MVEKEEAGEGAGAEEGSEARYNAERTRDDSDVKLTRKPDGQRG